MKAYTNTVPGSDVSYALVPIPAGEFVMGSSQGEKGREANEGPQRTVKVSPSTALTVSEVPWARCCDMPMKLTMRLTRIAPPPTPVIALKKPVKMPMTMPASPRTTRP